MKAIKEDEEVMVTIEESFTRKVSFPVRKGEQMKFGVKGGPRGYSLGN